jgi:hypothetical protein
MKPRTQIILLITVLLGVAALSSMKRGARSDADGRNSGACCPLIAALNAKPVAVGTNQISTNAAAQQVIAYYFHGMVRCETCLQIEQQAKAVIEQRFQAELNSKRLAFKSINYELPENAHFQTDYKLPCPSLVLVQQQASYEETWKLLGETWQLVHDPVKLNSYVEAEVRKYLSGQGQQTSTNQVELPPAPDHR